MAQAKLTYDREARLGSVRLKRVALFGAWLTVSPVLLLYAVARKILSGRSDEVLQGFSQLMSLAPGIPGNMMRLAFYRHVLRRCSATCSIGFGTIFATAEVEIGEHVYIGPGCMIGHSILCDDVLIGSNVDILGGKRQHYFDDLLRPVRLQGGHYEQVRIGRDAWIGNSAVILADVGDQAVVAAGAVVTRNVSCRSIVGGNPARRLGLRGGAEIAETVVESAPPGAAP